MIPYFAVLQPANARGQLNASRREGELGSSSSTDAGVCLPRRLGDHPGCRLQRLPAARRHRPSDRVLWRNCRCRASAMPARSTPSCARTDRTSRWRSCTSCCETRRCSTAPPRIGDDELAAIMAAVTKAFADQRLNPDLLFEARVIRTGDEQILRVSWDSYIR